MANSESAPTQSFLGLTIIAMVGMQFWLFFRECSLWLWIGLCCWSHSWLFPNGLLPEKAGAEEGKGVYFLLYIGLRRWFMRFFYDIVIMGWVCPLSYFLNRVVNGNC